MNDIFDVSVPWNLQTISRCIESIIRKIKKKKKIPRAAQRMKFSIKDFFSKCDQTIAGNCVLPLFMNMFVLALLNLTKHLKLLPNSQRFLGWSPWKMQGMASTSNRTKRKWKQLLISGKKTCHRIMNSRLGNKCMTPKRFF